MERTRLRCAAMGRHRKLGRCVAGICFHPQQHRSIRPHVDPLQPSNMSSSTRAAKRRKLSSQDAERARLIRLNDLPTASFQQQHIPPEWLLFRGSSRAQRHAVLPPRCDKADSTRSPSTPAGPSRARLPPLLRPAAPDVRQARTYRRSGARVGPGGQEGRDARRPQRAVPSSCTALRTTRPTGARRRPPRRAGSPSARGRRWGRGR